MITRWKMWHPTPAIGELRAWKHHKDNPIFMESCDEKKQIYFTAMNNYKVHKGSSQHIYHQKRGSARWKTVLSIATMHFHGIPPWRKNDENTSVLFNKTLSKLSRFPRCLEASWSLLFILACVTLLGRWVTPRTSTQILIDCNLSICKNLLRLPTIDPIPVHSTALFAFTAASAIRSVDASK